MSFDANYSSKFEEDSSGDEETKSSDRDSNVSSSSGGW